MVAISAWCSRNATQASEVVSAGISFSFLAGGEYTLADAREEARELRRQRRDGRNPLLLGRYPIAAITIILENLLVIEGGIYTPTGQLIFYYCISNSHILIVSRRVDPGGHKP